MPKKCTLPVLPSKTAGSVILLKFVVTRDPHQWFIPPASSPAKMFFVVNFAELSTPALSRHPCSARRGMSFERQYRHAGTGALVPPLTKAEFTVVDLLAELTQTKRTDLMG